MSTAASPAIGADQLEDVLVEVQLRRGPARRRRSGRARSPRADPRRGQGRGRAAGRVSAPILERSSSCSPFTAALGVGGVQPALVGQVLDARQERRATLSPMTIVGAPEDAATPEHDASAAFRRFSTLVAMRETFASTTLTSTQRLVLLAIINHANRHGQAFPGRQRLAEETALSRRAVSGALAALAKAGVLQWSTRRTRRGDPDTNLYTVNIPKAWDSKAPGALPRAPGATGVEQQVPQGRAPSAHKQIKEMDQLSQKESKGGEGKPPASPPVARLSGSKTAARSDGELPPDQKAAWSMLETIHRQLRITHYGSAGIREKVAKDNKAEVVDLLLDTAQEAHESLRALEPGSNWSLTDAYRRVAADVLDAWFEQYPGHEDYLSRKRHPLFVLKGDLTELVADWLGELNRRLEKQRTEAEAAKGVTAPT